MSDQADFRVVVPGDPAVDTVVAAAMPHAPELPVRPPYRLDVVVFRIEPVHVWPAYQERWLPAILKGLTLARVIAGPSDVTRIDFRLTATFAGQQRAHIAVRSLADSYRP